MSFCRTPATVALRAVAESVLQLLMEADVEELIGAGDKTADLKPLQLTPKAA